MSDYEAQGPSTLSVVIAIVTELGVIGLLAYILKVTITDRSGLNDPEKIGRIWSRAPEIIYQPISNALPFSVFIGIGCQTLILILLIMLFDFIHVSGAAGLLYPLFYPLTSWIVTSVALWIFTSTSQRDWRVCLGVASLVSTTVFVCGSLLTHQIDWVDRALHTHNGGTIVAITMVIYLLNSLVTTWLWSRDLKQTASARLIYNSTIIPPWVKLDRSILVAAVPLLVVEVFIKFMQRHYLTSSGYFVVVVFDLANIIALVIGTLTAIISVNRSLMVNEFQWQWRAFLTPAVPTAIYALLGLIYRLFVHGFGVLPSQLFSAARGTVNMGTCGVVGTYIYLRLAERYTRTQLGDAEIETDVFLADDDEDNEILEV